MNIYERNKTTLTFDDNKDNWIRFDRLRGGRVTVDKSGEPTLTPENIAVLIAWIGGAA